MRILIVEDEKKVASFIKKGLQQEGYAADIVQDGVEAVQNALTFDYDLIVLDLMLPKMSGVEVLKKMRVQPQLAKIPVIVFTNAHLQAMINSATEAGATKVLNKAETTPHKVIEAFKDAGCFAKDV